NGAPGILPSFSDSGTFEDFYAAGGVSLDYRITDRTTVYTSAKTGYAGGGFQDFNAQAPFGIPQPSFPSSTSQSFELGAKGLFLDDKLFLNGAAFFNRIENGHTQVFDSATFSFFVEPLDYTTFGFEAEAQYQINDYWQVFGAVGLTESRFFDVEPGVPSGAINGNPLPNVPMWQANFRAVNTLPLDDIGLKGNIVTTGEIQFVDERPADIANSFTLDSYVVVNAQIGWENENFKFYAFGRNLTDTNIQVFGEQFAADPVAGPFVNAVTLQSTDRIVGFGGEIRF
ncbi:MAG: TonB-dependent receptor, partial [Pseudomonadota bacterium]